MATIIPFRAIRPAKNKVHLVASRSVDGYSQEELKEKLSNNPYTFLHIINPDFTDNQKTKPGSVERLKKIKEKYINFIKQGILIADKAPAYYIYQQIKENQKYTGIIGCISIDDYYNQTIKIHEQTITEREQKLKQYLHVCDFNAEPVLFSYPNDITIDQIISSYLLLEPVYDFNTTDKVHHKLWVVNNLDDVTKIKKQFADIPSIYIADGHHRSASSALLGKEKRLSNPNYTGEEAFNYYLGVFFSEAQLKIYDFNRVVRDLNGLSIETFLEKTKEKFDVRENEDSIYIPCCKHNFSMYLDKKWYSLQAKKEIILNDEPVGSLDASILTEHVLSPLLQIHDLRTDIRIGFVSGIKGMQELKNKVDSGDYVVAFGLYPVNMEQLKQIADKGNIMPPKTTWVEPKMRSGLVVYNLYD